MDSLGKLPEVRHNLDFAKPFSLYCGKAEGGTGRIHGDIHYDIQIIVIMDGRMEVFYDDCSMILGRGQVWWTWCWEPHGSRILSESASYLVITLSPESTGMHDPFNEVNWLAAFLMPPKQRPRGSCRLEREHILSRAERLAELDRTRPDGCMTWQWLLIHELIIYLNSTIRSHSANSGKSARELNFRDRIMPAVRLIRSNPCKLLPLESAAEACSLSKSRFCRLFKSAMGDSFSSFAAKVRISSAASELRNPQNTIKSVAAKYGFADICHFYHVFRRYMKCTPVEYSEASGHPLSGRRRRNG